MVLFSDAVIFGGLFGGELVLFPEILAECQGTLAGFAPEETAKVGGGIELELGRDLGCGAVRMHEETFGLENDPIADQ